MEKKAVTKAQCNRCFGETNHEVLHIERRDLMEEYDNEVRLSYGETLEILNCSGCETLKARHTTWHEADIGFDGNMVMHVTYLPSASSRREPEWLSQWLNPSTTEFLFREVYVALKNGCSRLAVIGVRSVIENIMIELVGDNGSFAENLKCLEKAGYISSKQKEILGHIIDAGSATTHRGYSPSAEDLATILNIAESLYEIVYIHPPEANFLKERIPPRKPRTK